jgi:hypothetical protein
VPVPSLFCIRELPNSPRHDFLYIYVCGMKRLYPEDDVAAGAVLHPAVTSAMRCAEGEVTVPICPCTK